MYSAELRGPRPQRLRGRLCLVPARLLACCLHLGPPGFAVAGIQTPTSLQPVLEQLRAARHAGLFLVSHLNSDHMRRHWSVSLADSPSGEDEEPGQLRRRWQVAPTHWVCHVSCSYRLTPAHDASARCEQQTPTTMISMRQKAHGQGRKWPQIRPRGWCSTPSTTRVNPAGRAWGCADPT